MLEIQGVNYFAGERHILKDLNLSVKENSVHSILGVNGTGKTTLGFVLMGLSGYRPTSGRILFCGSDITDLSITDRARMGLTLAWQHSTSFEGITIRDYLLVASRNAKTHGDGGVDAADALRALGLEPDEYLNRNYDSTLSGGERKRIELAAIMVMRPRLAILDEPDSGIDAISIEKIADVIRHINQNGSTILLITHSWKIAGIADISSSLCNGTILLSGEPYRVTQFFVRQCQQCTHKNEPKPEEIIDAEG
ncbi:MAG: ABC transporter ATP-binding protein [Spirochaetes bacterium]|nr:ABC transporter ATP-binding protein [Spirochaetota bacterium]